MPRIICGTMPNISDSAIHHQFMPRRNVSATSRQFNSRYIHHSMSSPKAMGSTVFSTCAGHRCEAG